MCCACFLICFQVCSGLATWNTLFGYIYYKPTLTTADTSLPIQSQYIRWACSQTWNTKLCILPKYSWCTLWCASIIWQCVLIGRRQTRWNAGWFVCYNLCQNRILWWIAWCSADHLWIIHVIRIRKTGWDANIGVYKINTLLYALG